MNKVFSIKSGKRVGSGKVVLLIFLTVLISRQKAISVFSLNGLAVKVFNLLILECPLTLERSEINRKPTFPLFPEEVGQKGAFPLSFREGRTNPYLMQGSEEPFPLFPQGERNRVGLLSLYRLTPFDGCRSTNRIKEGGFQWKNS